MKKMLISVLVTSLMFVVGSGTVSAQDGFKVIPVELLTCTYRDRKDSDDLDDFVDKSSC